MLYIKLFIEREKNTGQSAPECPFKLLDVEYYRDFEMWVRGHSRLLKMVPFESLGTMAVSLAISKIFSVKEWPDLEIWVWDRSRSLKMARFDRPYMTFY